MINPDKLKKDFGKFIKEGRERKYLTQWQVADKIGVSQVQISHLENGNRPLDFPLVLQICEALHLDIKDFIDKYL